MVETRLGLGPSQTELLKPRLLSHLIEYMLGDQFYEHKGKIIGQRVLDVNGEEGPIETTFSAEAKVKFTLRFLPM